MERARFSRRPRKGKAERALQVRMAIECEAVAAGLSASKYQECKIVHDLFDFAAIDDIVSVPAWREVVTRFFSSGSSGATGAANGDAVPGQFDVALNGPQKAIVRSALKASGAEGAVRGTLQSIAGPEFSSRGLRMLEEPVLDAATWNEAGRMDN